MSDLLVSLDDPFRARWYDFCHSLTTEQIAALVEGLERRARRSYENGRAQGYADGVRDGRLAVSEDQR